MCGTNGDCGCGCPRQRRGFQVSGVVVGADGGFSPARVNEKVERLASTLDSAGVHNQGWSAWLSNWRARWRSMSGAEVTSAVESLAQYAERLAGAAHDTRRTMVQGVAQVGAIPSEVKAVDDAISGVISAIAPALPYGNIIKAAHDTRRRAMYGDEPTAKGGAQPQGTDRQKVMDAQALSRGMRRGDPTAQGEVMRLRGATDGASRKRLAMVSVARRDDDARIERTYRQGRA